MPRWVGLLGSWAMLVLGLGIFGYAVAAEAITMTDARKLHRVKVIDGLIMEHVNQQLESLQQSMSTASTSMTSLQSEVASANKTIEETHDSSFVITVSTAEKLTKPPGR